MFPKKTLYASDNNGDTWAKVMTIPAEEEVFDVSVFNGRVYAATSKGLFVSADEGAHWTQEPGVKEGYVSAVVAAKTYVLVWAQTATKNNVFYSSADGVKWNTVKGEGVWPQDIDVSGDNMIGTFCQNLGGTDNGWACRGYMLWVVAKGAKKWEHVDFKARYFALDGDNIYAIKVHVTDEKKKEPEYVREVVKSDDKGRNWEIVDEKTEPFVLSDYDMQEKLRELDDWKSFEVAQVVAYRKGQKLAAEQKAKELQDEQKRRKAEAAKEYYSSGSSSNPYAAQKQPDYRAQSQDRFNARHNTRSYIDSKGGIHIR